MSLLKLSDLKDYDPAGKEEVRLAPVPAFDAQGKATFMVGRHGADLEHLIPELQQEHSYFIPTRGEWSQHEMLAFLLHRIGPAKVWVTSWSISQDPLRQVLDMQRDGRITQLKCLFDSRVTTECPQAFQLTLAHNTEVKLAKNHSKLLVLINGEWAVFVHSSANLTTNPRLEFYSIHTHRELALWNTQWINMEMAGAQPFDQE